ncbi:hypothetical protein PTSG_04886 [Salpingoeca rosetta]|uniref:PH domain-containing protein n=1 Tax=Salpingoeca rosetta (strain ATCC 50818 / BSB-021) TaxID=946362 RepID=F2U8X0_SALR5|nr:uncharacterized protein PTSG_04886 [Salpingoeca rosetta]EGD73173.1 hypothetical protein PTSG_04886 [Salpingoeca rosetta]|eukprot:XP_004994204.1 hypothetical protein PTSG_04886 [Salpingoeca rosetta]
MDLATLSNEAGQDITEDVKITQGWLMKRGKVNKAFKKRWFKFKDGCLTYQVQAGAPARGTIPLSQIESVVISSGAPAELYIQVPGRVYIIRSVDESAWTLRGWLRSIQDARSNTNTDSRQPPR